MKKPPGTTTKTASPAVRRPAAKNHPRPSGQRLIQPKSLTALQKPKRPAAPEAYHPHPMPRVLQMKAAGNQTSQTGHKPVAPPAYRPQPVPKVLQRKTAHLQAGFVQSKEKELQPSATPTHGPRRLLGVLQTKPAVANPPHGQTGRAPVAPPVYRPQPLQKVLQRKLAGSKQSHAGEPSVRPVNPPASRRAPPDNAHGGIQKRGAASRPAAPVPASRVIQRVLGTYVAVNSGGPEWHGKIVESRDDYYMVEVGGTGDKKNPGHKVKVSRDQVSLHSAVAASRNVLAKKFNAVGVVTEIRKMRLKNAWPHDPETQFRTLMRVYELSTTTAESAAKLVGDKEKLQQLVWGVECSSGAVRIFQHDAWERWLEKPKPDDLRDIMQQGLTLFMQIWELLSSNTKALEEFVYDALAHDKPYVTTVGELMNYSLRALTGEEREDPMAKWLSSGLNYDIVTINLIPRKTGAAQLKSVCDKYSKDSAEYLAMWQALTAPIYTKYKVTNASEFRTHFANIKKDLTGFMPNDYIDGILTRLGELF